MKNDVIYVKADQNVEVKTLQVTIGDILSLESSNQELLAKIKPIKILKFPEKGSRRSVVSMLRIIQMIHKAVPEVQIESLGAPDVIVTYEEPKPPNRWIHVLKIVGVSVITFVGSGFSIMAFNNDISTAGLFSQIYELLTGTKSDGFTILELTYSIGLVIGILIFFNHFAGKKFSVDPTPMEVEMRLYENDIQTTLVENYARKGQEIDVGDPNRIDDHRT